jgi:mono/diheme cytochrome c family protein
MGGIAALFVLAAACPLHPAAAADAALVERGQYLAIAGDCVSCHTAPGGKRFAGGRSMSTPFGSIATPNITPDKATGIGGWTDDQFYRAMHDGIGKSGEFLYPVFPFPWYTKVSREDVLAIKAYLETLPPEHAPRPKLQLSFPFDIRESLQAWRTAFFTAGSFAPDPKRDARINRGAYLVEGLGHCGECHNEDNIFGASDWSGRLKGGRVEGWYAPDLTGDGTHGIGNWTEDQLVAFLKTGAAPGKGLALGPMKLTIDDSLSHLSDADLHAIAAYLKSNSAGVRHKPAETATASADQAGAAAYLTHCASCHRVDGRGVPGRIPALAGNGAAISEGPENVIRVVLGGLPASHGFSPMPAVGAAMTDAEIAAAVNYVRLSWGNAAPANAEPGLVADLRAKTRTLLAGNAPGGCPPIADPKLAAALQAPALRQQFVGVDQGNMLERVDAILPEAEATGSTPDAIVNAMTSAYCPALANVPPADRSVLLGDFSVLAYGQIEQAGHRN